MTTKIRDISVASVTCSDCNASCCCLEVMLVTDTNVPNSLIDTDRWGAEVMARLEDGWCSALDRTNSKCSIYENRPWICREFEMGSYECIEERSKTIS